MSDRAKLLRLATWALFFLVLAIWAGQNMFRCGPGAALVSRPAPSFEGAIVGGEGSESGDRISLASLRGRPVLLDFWASWCAPCRASVPILSRLASRHRDGGLVALGVNIEGDAPRAHVARSHAALRAGFPTLHDETWAIQRDYGVQSIPTVILIDRRGVVRWVEIGVPSEADLEAQIVEITSEPR